MKTEAIIAKGNEAIALADTDSTVILHKYADPTEGARENISVEDAREIAREDPSLIYATSSIGVDSTGTWTAAQYVIDAGWDRACVEATAANGVSVEDARDLTGEQQAALLDYCRAQ